MGDNSDVTIVKVTIYIISLTFQERDNALNINTTSGDKKLTATVDLC